MSKSGRADHVRDGLANQSGRSIHRVSRADKSAAPEIECCGYAVRSVNVAVIIESQLVDSEIEIAAAQYFKCARRCN